MKEKTDQEEIQKAVEELNGFKSGDSVKVKNGINDPDDEKQDISGWCGRLKEIYDDGIALIKWDSITIRSMNIKKIRKYEKEGYGWDEMYLGLDEIEKSSPRDKIDDAEEEMSKIQWKYFRKEYFPEYDDE